MFLALSLAVIYLFGAIDLIGQLLYAGIRPSDALPVIPIEQILARGIVVGAEALLLLVAVILIVAMGEVVVDLSLSSGNRGAHARNSSPFALTRENAPALVMGVGFIAMFMPPPVLLQMIPPLVVLSLVTLLMAEQKRYRRLSTAALAVVVTLVLSTSFVFPDPLPKIELQGNTGPIASGTLVTSTGSAWYIAEGSELVSIPLEKVTEARAKSRSMGGESMLNRLLSD
jgi:hypothetical protein